MDDWEVEVDITPDDGELAGLLDRWCRHRATRDTCAHAEGGAHITHRLRATGEQAAKDETLDEVGRFFSAYSVRCTDQPRKTS